MMATAAPTPPLGQVMRQFTASKTMALNNLAKDLQKAGHDVCNLTVGEPAEDTPDHIKEAIIQALRDGDTKYTPPAGKMEYRAIIANATAQDYNLPCAPEQVIISTGGKQVIENVLHATIDPGDEVILFNPYWTSYRDLVRMYGGVPVPVLTPAQNGFKPDAESLARAITPKTKWVFINSCNNPTGAKYTRAELTALAEVLLLPQHQHVWILSDDIYGKLSYDGEPFVNLAQLHPELSARTLILNGLSKSYMATGLRIGWGVGDARLIAAMTAVQSQTTSGAVSICQAAIPAALLGPQDHHVVQLSRYRARRDLMLTGIQQTPGLKCTVPMGAFYLFCDVGGWVGKTTPQGDILSDDTAVCEHLLRRHYIAAVPGSAFGCGDGHFMRLTYAKDEAVLAEATRRLQNIGADLRPRP